MKRGFTKAGTIFEKRRYIFNIIDLNQLHNKTIDSK